MKAEYTRFQSGSGLNFKTNAREKENHTTIQKLTTNRSIASVANIRNASLPLIKATQLNPQNFKWNVRADSVIQTDQLPKLIIPNNKDRLDHPPAPNSQLNITIMSPYLVSPSNKPSDKQTICPKAKVRQPGESFDRITNDENREIAEDTKKNDSYLISVLPPTNPDGPEIDADQSQIRFLDETKDDINGSNFFQNKFNRFKPVDSMIEEKVESSKKSHFDNDLSVIKHMSPKENEDSSLIHKEQFNFPAVSNELNTEKDKTDTLDLIAIDDVSSKKKPVHSRSSHQDTIFMVKRTPLTYKSSNFATDLKGDGEVASPTSHHNFSSVLIPESNRKYLMLQSPLPKGSSTSRKDKSLIKLNLVRKPSTLNQVDNLNKSRRSEFNYDEYLEQELGARIHENNTSYRTPDDRSQTGQRQVDVKKTKRDAPRPDWRSENSSFRLMEDFSSEG